MFSSNSKIHFETLGCKLNQVESEGLAACFVNAGFTADMTPVTAACSVDNDVVLCVINTCTVTAKAEQKARRIIRLLLAKYPQSAVVVTGCYAQLGRKEILAMDERVCVLGGQYKGRLSEIPERIQNEEFDSPQKLSAFLNGTFDSIYKNAAPGKIDSPFRLLPDNFIHHTRPSLKIQDGCNCVCTYCAIRLARGKSVSLDAEEVIRRVRQLEQNGHKEVVITTVNIGQYRSKWQDKTVDFTDLLELILQNTNSIHIRISSLYPEIVDERLAKVIADERVQSHFHISVQSGSDDVLLKMKRPYKIEAVYRACRLLKQAKGNPFLACDIIVGFPGESDRDFELTLSMLKECGFTFVHAFPFSARPGTEAYKMRPMVPNSIAKVRMEALEKFNEESKKAYIESYQGQFLNAISETVHNARVFKDRVVVHAVTENFLHCRLDFPKDAQIPQPGSLIQVRIRRPLSRAEVSGESDTLAEFVSVLS